MPTNNDRSPTWRGFKSTARAFLLEQAQTTGNLTTDGQIVLSYGWFVIARHGTCVEGSAKPVVELRTYESARYSATTGRQWSAINQVLQEAFKDGLIELVYVAADVSKSDFISMTKGEEK